MPRKKQMIKSVLPVFVLVCFSFSGTSMAKDLGVFGAVYDITEKDALKEIEEKAREVDIKRAINRGELATKVKNYTPGDLKEAKLPPARKERTFLVDMTYTLDRDIADEKGNVIYPKGYTFNPLDYITYPGVIVILDAKSPQQVAWFKQSAYGNDPMTKLLITDGSCADSSTALRRPVFYASRAIVDIFQIEAVPSVVRQKGAFMDVREIPVEKTAVKPGLQ